MDMVYSSSTCNVCGRLPSMGWLYECQQDRMESCLQEIDTKTKATHAIETFHIRDLKTLQCSQSVIQQAKDDCYTDHQLEVLKDQKWKVNEMIATRLQIWVQQQDEELDHDGKVHPNVTMRKKRNNTTGTHEALINQSSRTAIDARCHLKSCHVRTRTSPVLSANQD